MDVPRGTRERLNDFVNLVLDENDQQNLIARSTAETIWARHIEDSLQLIPLAPETGSWLDIGSGAGFPGLAVALANPRRVVLIEPRRLRAEFLKRAASALRATNVEVVIDKVERVRLPPCAVISARAVAPLETLFAMAMHLADDQTIWLLPKGRNAADELESARRSWQGAFRLVPSRTDAEAAIVVASGVRKKGAA